MRRILLILGVLIGVATSQAAFRWGPTVGVNITHFSWKQDLVPSKDALGFNGGILGELMIPGIGFGIDVGLRYSMIGADVDFGSKTIWASDGWGN